MSTKCEKVKPILHVGKLRDQKNPYFYNIKLDGQVILLPNTFLPIIWQVKVALMSEIFNKQCTSMAQQQ